MTIIRRKTTNVTSTDSGIETTIPIKREGKNSLFWLCGHNMYSSHNCKAIFIQSDHKNTRLEIVAVKHLVGK